MKKQLVTLITLLALGGSQLSYALDRDVIQDLNRVDTQESRAMMLDLIEWGMAGYFLGKEIMELYNR